MLADNDLTSSTQVSCFYPVKYLISAHTTVAFSGLVLWLQTTAPEKWPSTEQTLAFGQLVKGASMETEPVYKRSAYPGQDQVTTGLQCHLKCHSHALMSQWSFSAWGGPPCWVKWKKLVMFLFFFMAVHDCMWRPWHQTLDLDCGSHW